MKTSSLNQKYDEQLGRQGMTYWLFFKQQIKLKKYFKSVPTRIQVDKTGNKRPLAHITVSRQTKI